MKHSLKMQGTFLPLMQQPPLSGCRKVKGVFRATPSFKCFTANFASLKISLTWQWCAICPQYSLQPLMNHSTLLRPMTAGWKLQHGNIAQRDLNHSCLGSLPTLQSWWWISSRLRRSGAGLGLGASVDDSQT
ncbi:hypothetical protein EmuJ_000292900 [Echinococcus multilocularis]|uniref:Uncharacterized protein n=1 Tax=Echinococcus multilocularis TaxID=6211 RepID=A0A068XTB2_ECHMU|nr:hypothetical protein EmuJ_000292900 [Echinococcus multilocularis]